MEAFWVAKAEIRACYGLKIAFTLVTMSKAPTVFTARLTGLAGVIITYVGTVFTSRVFLSNQCLVRIIHEILSCVLSYIISAPIIFPLLAVPLDRVVYIIPWILNYRVLNYSVQALCMIV